MKQTKFLKMEGENKRRQETRREENRIQNRKITTYCTKNMLCNTTLLFVRIKCEFYIGLILFFACDAYDTESFSFFVHSSLNIIVTIHCV